jgi:hypothetical protein
MLIIIKHSIFVLNNETFVEQVHLGQLLDSNSNVHEHYDHRILPAMNQLFENKEKNELLFK